MYRFLFGFGRYFIAGNYDEFPGTVEFFSECFDIGGDIVIGQKQKIIPVIAVPFDNNLR